MAVARAVAWAVARAVLDWQAVAATAVGQAAADCAAAGSEAASSSPSQLVASRPLLRRLRPRAEAAKAVAVAARLRS